MTSTLLLDALRGRNHNRPPIWLMRQAGRYMPSYQKIRERASFLEMCTKPELIEKVTLLPIQELNVDAAILFSDILLVPQALGFDLRFDESKGPIITNPLESISDLSKFQIQHQFPFVTEAIHSLKKRLKVPLIGFAGAPFTLASYIIEGTLSRDLKKTKKWLYQDIEGFTKILHFLEKAIIQSLKIQIQAGCEVIQLFDSWAHVLSIPQFEQLCLQSLTRIVQALNVPTIYFCKNSSFLAPLIAKTGVTAISLDWLKPLHEVRANLPQHPLQGNLDPSALHLPKTLMKNEVQKILQSMHKDPRFIFNLGHGILPDAPYDQVKHLIDLVKNSV